MRVSSRGCRQGPQYPSPLHQRCQPAPRVDSPRSLHADSSLQNLQRPLQGPLTGNWSCPRTSPCSDCRKTCWLDRCSPARYRPRNGMIEWAYTQVHNGQTRSSAPTWDGPIDRHRGRPACLPAPWIRRLKANRPWLGSRAVRCLSYVEIGSVHDDFRLDADAHRAPVFAVDLDWQGEF